MRRFSAFLALPTLALLLGSVGATLSSCDTAGCEGGTLQIEDLEVGDGAEAMVTSTVVVAYVGTFEDGTVFDETEADMPATFDLSNLIDGFREGIAGNDAIPPMRVGGRRMLTIPPDQAYGESGSASGAIPPCTTLRFEVTLLDVQ